MAMLEVGKPYAPLAGRGDGVLFDIDDAGAAMFICLDCPTNSEIASAKAGQAFQIKFLERGGIIWILVKCGSMAWMDAPYNPRTSPFTRLEHPAAGQGLGLTLCVADSRTAEIKSMRLIGLGEKFSLALIEAAERLRNEPMSITDVSRSINETLQKYNTPALVSMASNYFKLKE